MRAVARRDTVGGERFHLGSLPQVACFIVRLNPVQFFFEIEYGPLLAGARADTPWQNDERGVG